MNEIIFFSHSVFCFFFLFLSLRLGKEALIGFIGISAVFANLFVLKQVILFGLEVTCSEVYAVAGILGINLLQEIHGKRQARKAAHFSLFFLVFFACMAKIHLAYLPSASDFSQSAYFSILSSTPRMIMGSLFVYWIIQYIDIRIFQFLKKNWREKRLGFRLFLSAAITQFLDTILFTFLALYGVVSSVFDVICVSLCIKYLLILCSSPLAVFFKLTIPKEST